MYTTELSIFVPIFFVAASGSKKNFANVHVIVFDF